MVAQARPPIPPLPTVKYVEDGPSIKVGKEEAPRSQESTHSEILAAAFSTAVALDFSVTADGRVESAQASCRHVFQRHPFGGCRELRNMLRPRPCKDLPRPFLSAQEDIDIKDYEAVFAHLQLQA